MTFVFENGPGLLRLIRHSFLAKEHFGTYGQEPPIPAGLWLVHDAGVYLMSNGKPGIPHQDGRNVVYAEGHGPDTYLGGDDYAEHLPLEWFADGSGFPHNCGQFIITLTDEEIKCQRVNLPKVKP